MTSIAEWLMSVLHPTVRWHLASLPSTRIQLTQEDAAGPLDRVLLNEGSRCESDFLRGSRLHCQPVKLRPDTTRLVQAFTNTVYTLYAKRLAAPTCTIAGAGERPHSWWPEKSELGAADSVLLAPRRFLQHWMHPSHQNWPRL